MGRNRLGTDDDACGGDHGQGEAVIPGLPGIDKQQDDGPGAQGRHGGGAAPYHDAQEHDGAHGGRAQYRARGAYQDHEESQQDRPEQCPPAPGNDPEGGQAQAQDDGDVLPGDGSQVGHGHGAHVLAHLGG